jgi:hypothetical protein
MTINTTQTCTTQTTQFHSLSESSSKTVENVNPVTFGSLLQPYQPLIDQALQIAQSLNEPNAQFDREKSILEATENHKAKLAISLLDKGPISKKTRGRAVIIATQSNHIEIIRALLAHGPISHYHREIAVIDAAENNNIELVAELLAEGPMSFGALKSAVCHGARNNNLNLILLLLAGVNGPPSDSLRGYAVVTATEDNNIELVTALLASGSISGASRNSAISKAAKNKNEELFQLLNISFGFEILYEANPVGRQIDAIV